MIPMLLAWGCSASTPTPARTRPETAAPPDSAAPAPTADTAAPADTSHSDATVDSGPAFMTFRYRVWEWDRECWALRDVERPAEYWEAYYADSCNQSGFGGEYYGGFRALSDAEGNCVTMHEGFPPPSRCELLDPFVRPCEEAPGCCDQARADRPFSLACVPNYWQP